MAKEQLKLPTDNTIDKMECESASNTSSNEDASLNRDIIEECMSSKSNDNNGDEGGRSITNSHIPQLSKKTPDKTSNFFASQENKKQKLNHLTSFGEGTDFPQNRAENSDTNKSSMNELEAHNHYNTTVKEQWNIDQITNGTSLNRAKMNGREASKKQSESDHEWEEISRTIQRQKNRGQTKEWPAPSHRYRSRWSN